MNDSNESKLVKSELEEVVRSWQLTIGNLVVTLTVHATTETGILFDMTGFPQEELDKAEKEKNHQARPFLYLTGVPYEKVIGLREILDCASKMCGDAMSEEDIRSVEETFIWAADRERAEKAAKLEASKKDDKTPVQKLPAVPSTTTGVRNTSQQASAVKS